MPCIGCGQWIKRKVEWVECNDVPIKYVTSEQWNNIWKVDGFDEESNRRYFCVCDLCEQNVRETHANPWAAHRDSHSWWVRLMLEDAYWKFKRKQR